MKGILNLSFLVVFLTAGSVLSQVPVEGIADQTVYTDRVSFRVPVSAGYSYTVSLDDVAAPSGVWVEVNQPDYHELQVIRHDDSSGIDETRLVQFIVRASERASTEVGLPVWTPYPMIPSAQAEFAGAKLRIVTPESYPQGLEIPVVAWVVDANGARVGVNGTVSAPEFQDRPLQVLRGVGSVFLPAATAPGSLTYTASIQTLQAPKVIRIEASTAWTEVSGTILISTDWGENARISVTGDLTVAAGATLTIGPGSVVRIRGTADVKASPEITVNGAIVATGTQDRPVVFTAEDRKMPWGGFLLRTSFSRMVMTWTILTGGCADPKWFDNNSGTGSSHRHEQCLFYLQNGARATFTDCFLIDNKGQAGHGEGSFLTMTRCLVQRFVTSGQFNGGSVNLDRCALVEFPQEGAAFVDGDNDAMYLTGGSHSLKDCLIGWTLDDGVDAGGGDGPVEFQGCWFESCMHEGLAMSTANRRTIRDTVTINCGQGIECGYGSERVDAQQCLSTANLSGARFGDCYDWDYTGSLKVADSLLLYNHRDVFPYNWADWTIRFDQIDVQGNLLTVPNSDFPNNAVWQPDTDANLLLPFLPVPQGDVGVGFALRSGKIERSQISKGLPVRLSVFSLYPVSVDYVVQSEGGVLENGTLLFTQGETLKQITPSIAGLQSGKAVWVTLQNPVHAELTGLWRIDVLGETKAVLVEKGSIWRYLDTGKDQGTAWRAKAFDDGTWLLGAAELGNGDGDEVTKIDIGPSGTRYPTLYFRHAFQVDDPNQFEGLTVNLKRDDGAVVYLNGREVFRSNMAEGIAILYTTWAAATTDSETAYYLKEISADYLNAGENVIAVEVHQDKPTSSDISFDLELVGTYGR